LERYREEGLNQFGSEKDAYEIIGTDAVGAVAGANCANKAIAVNPGGAGGHPYVHCLPF